MVRVELYQSGPGELTGFRAVGHAGYAPPGEDIVCAGVSAVTQAAVLGLKDYLELNVSLKAEDGLLECRLPREIPDEKRASAKAILETMVLALREIEDGHGRYFALISLDAPRTSRGHTRGGRRGRRVEGVAKKEAPAAKAARGGRGAKAKATEAKAIGAKATEAKATEARAAEAKAAQAKAAPEAGQPDEATQPGEATSRSGERRRKSSHRRQSERPSQNGVPVADDGASDAVPESRSSDWDQREAPESKRPEPPASLPEPEPERQVAVAQEPAAENEKQSVLNPFRRRRLRSFKPGRLGRRWRP